jgi:tyrosyl-tRNA synthetase
MSSSDPLMWRWYELQSMCPEADLARLRAEVAAGRNPRDAKVLLAKEIVERFHSPAAAEAAAAEFDAQFRGGAAPAQMPEFNLPGAGGRGLPIGALLKQAGLAPSTTEALRNVEQGGVRIDGVKITDRALHVASGTYVVQVGKRKWARVTVA